MRLGRAQARAGKGVFVFVLVAVVAWSGVADFQVQMAPGAKSVVVASRIDINVDFSACSIRFANEGNVTDTTRSVLVFYTGAESSESIVRNADPPPNLTIAPGGTADWDCTSSFGGSPPGVRGESVNVVVSAAISRERSSVGYFN